MPAFGPVRIRLGLNRLMIAGMLVGLVGIAGWTLDEFGAFRMGPILVWGFRGLAFAGLALYFLGRVVQFWTHMRNRR